MYSKFYVNLHYKQFYNNNFRTKKDIMGFLIRHSIKIAFGLFIVMLLTRYLSPILESLNIKENVFVGVALLSLKVSIFSVLIFFDIIKNIVKGIYDTDKLNMLLITPLPEASLFMEGFFAYIVRQFLSKFYSTLVFIIYIGTIYSAGALYYILILPVIFLISILAGSFGILIGIVGVKFLSIKTYDMIMRSSTFIIFILSMVFLRSIKSLIVPISEYLMTLFQNQMFVNIFPLTAAIKILKELLISNTEKIWQPLIILSTLSFIVILILYFISKKIFLEGWYKVQEFEAEKRSKGSDNPIKISLDIPINLNSNRNIYTNLIFGDLKQILRKQWELIFFFACYGLYIGLYVVLQKGVLFTNIPYLSIIILTAFSSYFVVKYLFSIFAPTDVDADIAYKNKYWLLKILPINPRIFIYTEFAKVFIPVVILCIFPIVTFMITQKFCLITILKVMLLFLLIIAGNTSIVTGIDFLRASKYTGQVEYYLGVIGELCTLIFNFIVLTPFALLIFKDTLVNVRILKCIVSFINNPTVAAIFTSIICILTIFYFLRMAHKGWANLEI